MRLQTKTTMLTAWLFVGMILVIVPASLFAFRHYSISSAEEQVRSAAEIVRVSLTEAMINQVIDHRESFLTRLAEVKGLLEARVVRGAWVTDQFGPGLRAERTMDPVEEQVLRTGQTYFDMLTEGTNPIFRGTIPFVADERGSPNCLGCHQVPNGAVLGAITITLSLSSLKHQALSTILLLVILIIVFALVAALIFRWQVAPVAQVANRVQAVVAQAKGGDFRARVVYAGADELGEIARDLNWMMTYLQDNLGAITHEVARLLQFELKGNTNLLATTSEMVNTLVEVAQFKLAVEEDRTRREVYQRLARILAGQFDLDRFSIYEVAASQNHMKPMVVDGQADAPCRWCQQEILFQADACRAQRTGHTVDSIDDPHTCALFLGEEEDSGLGHICIPVLHAGAVGSVVQLVIPRKHGPLLQLLLPFIKVYLRESAPVVQAKRLMDTLRESALRDALTGLHNRRFLEEYVETMVATAQRKEQRFSILMIDLDHFKQVNDTHGHEAGDTVLRTIAQLVARQVRTSDLVIRFGGEEFMVLLQETSGFTGDMVAEKIRRIVADTPITIPGCVLSKTLSIGVAIYPDAGADFWDTVKLADQALYRAKDTGRNRVVIHEAPQRI
ncbi:MAG: diguanylate cyclase [Magnetococcales bacterium]|nr:diguanylate cyclase [Magnetococcales bacterium]